MKKTSHFNLVPQHAQAIHLSLTHNQTIREKEMNLINREKVMVVMKMKR